MKDGTQIMEEFMERCLAKDKMIDEQSFVKFAEIIAKMIDKESKKLKQDIRELKKTRTEIRNEYGKELREGSYL